MISLSPSSINTPLDTYKLLEDGLRLFSMSGPHSLYNAQEVHTYLVLPIKHNRARLYYGDKEHKFPIAMVTWVWLSPENGGKFLNDEYAPTDEDYSRENPDGCDLWGIEFIAPFGHTLKMMRAIRKEHKELYGTATKVHFRRFYDRNTLHKRTF